MITLNLSQLKQILVNAPEARLNIFLDPLNKAFAEFNINTPLRICHFLAQTAHESGEFRYLKELADGSAYDTGQKAIDLGNTPIPDGDGQMYKGRGLIQITGKSNYRNCGKAIRVDLMSAPERLEEPVNAVRSACWFWNTRNLSLYADKDLLEAITKRVNGGYNGLEERRHYLVLAKKAFSCQ